MAAPNEDILISLSSKLMAKREEAEKNIVQVHSNIKSKLNQKKEDLKKEAKKLEQMQEESSSLTYKSAILSAEASKLKTKISKVQNEVQGIMCKIDEIIPKQMIANMVLEKEELSLKIHYEDMERREKQLKEFWDNTVLLSDNGELQAKKKKLIERQEALEDQINRIKDKYSASTASKLTEECMILRKRNAAFLRRKTRILEQLQQSISEKKEELVRARRNVTFRCS